MRATWDRFSLPTAYRLTRSAACHVEHCLCVSATCLGLEIVGFAFFGAIDALVLTSDTTRLVDVIFIHGVRLPESSRYSLSPASSTLPTMITMRTTNRNGDKRSLISSSCPGRNFWDRRRICELDRYPLCQFDLPESTTELRGDCRILIRPRKPLHESFERKLLWQH